MSGDRAEDPPTSNVTVLNPERAVDEGETSGKPAPVFAGAAKPAEEETHAPNEALRKELKEARALLFYASDEGIEIDKAVMETIVSSSEKKKLSHKEVVEAITSMTTLSKNLKEKADNDIRPLIWGVVALGLFLVVTSTASFLTGSYSKALTDEITTANLLALDLNTGNVTQIADPAMKDAIITDPKTLATLQQFATGIRGIYETSNLLRGLLFREELPERQLTVSEEAAATPGQPGAASNNQRPPLELRIPATYGQIKDKTEQYQTVRKYARSLQDTQTAIYGALSNSILPSLYAILGVCAFLLKSYAEQVQAHTFKMSRSADYARIIIAAIGGGVVGLFGNFTSTPGTSLSMLAIAFLIGYATDVFFTFLDGLEQAFMKSRTGDQKRNSDGATQPSTKTA
jgi:hypothetical protein